MIGITSAILTSLLAVLQSVPAPSQEVIKPLAPLEEGPSQDCLVVAFDDEQSRLDCCDCCCDCCNDAAGWFDELTFFGGIDGSKQPQDFGVNANLGGQANVNWGLPLSHELGLGLQVGQGIVATDNAVRVYELLGEATSRVQSFTTVGLFQRTESGFSWGFAYDWLEENSFDDFSLSQWRLRGAYDIAPCDQVGVTANLSGNGDDGTFGATPVRLRAIDQGNLFWRHWWPTGVQTTAWGGVAGVHGENNAVTGPSPSFGDSFLMGADILAPLNDYFAIYGETNLIFPADTGTVDAFLGLQFYPGGGAMRARRGKYSPLLPVASPTAFSTDLLQ